MTRRCFTSCTSDHDTDCLSATKPPTASASRINSEYTVALRPALQRIGVSVNHRDCQSAPYRRCVTYSNVKRSAFSIQTGFKTVAGPSFDLPTPTLSLRAVQSSVRRRAKGNRFHAGSLGRHKRQDKACSRPGCPPVRVAIGDCSAISQDKLQANLPRRERSSSAACSIPTGQPTSQYGGRRVPTGNAYGKHTVLPMITSYGFGTVKYVENISPTASTIFPPTSRHTMLGAVVKSYYAKKSALTPGHCSCLSNARTAKKFELPNPEMISGDNRTSRDHNDKRACRND